MDTAKKVIKLFTKYKLYVLVLLIGIPIISKLNIWSKTMLGTIVDNVANADRWISIVKAYVIIAVALFGVKQGYSIIEQRLEFKLTYNLRAAIAEKILHINSESLVMYSTDDIMQMWNDDVREIQKVSIKSICEFLILFVSAVLAIIELGKISILFPFIAVSINILVIVPVRVLGRRNKNKAMKQRESQVAMNEKFYIILNAIRLIKAFGKEKDELLKFDKINNRYVDDKLSFSLATRIYKSVVTSLNTIAPTVVLSISVFWIRDGLLTIGDIVMALSLLETVSKPFGEVGNFLVNLKTIGFKFEHLFQFLEMGNEQTTGKSLEEDEHYSIELKNVFYQINGSNILENINVTFDSGEKVAVVGESGSGKTTLNNLILRIYNPTRGKVLLNGNDVQEFDLRTYRKGIHYSQSNTYISNRSILQNLAILGAEEDLCIKIAKDINFHDEIIAMADGYNTVLDASSSNISGGQKKKIAIIRALAQRSHLYVFDEITRGIDETSAITIMDYLLDHVKETAIFTMHDFYAIERMDKIIVMQSGHIIAEGSHSDLYENCEYYRELYDNRRRAGNE